MKKVVLKSIEIVPETMTPGRIYGVVMDYREKNKDKKSQIDICIIKETAGICRLESFISGVSYPSTNKENLLQFSKTLLSNGAYEIFEFDNVLDFFEWGVKTSQELMTKHEISAIEIGAEPKE